LACLSSYPSVAGNRHHHHNDHSEPLAPSTQSLLPSQLHQAPHHHLPVCVVSLGSRSFHSCFRSCIRHSSSCPDFSPVNLTPLSSSHPPIPARPALYTIPLSSLSLSLQHHHITSSTRSPTSLSLSHPSSQSSGHLNLSALILWMHTPTHLFPPLPLTPSLVLFAPTSFVRHRPPNRDASVI
jgi:hypothetical protein